VWGDIEKGLLQFKGVPGRLEIIIKKPFTVVVDYAHTPDSLRKVYSTLRADYMHTGGSLICVLGSAGGGRDKWKRLEMGRVAGEYCADIILTNEDPYDESPEEIMKEIKTGVLSTSFPISRLQEVVDRKEAIRTALLIAREGDVVVMTGKGSETSIHGAQGEIIPWNESEIVRTLVGERIKSF
jgi:UDP-N-acetylmuramoyl-L-alanyl-D-glutamate--2,6-diaminopimelate ligase